MNSQDPAEPSSYIKVQDIGTGRSKTPLIVASQVIVCMCFLIFEQASRNLIADSKTVLIWSFKQAIPNTST